MNKPVKRLRYKKVEEKNKEKVKRKLFCEETLKEKTSSMNLRSAMPDTM